MRSFLQFIIYTSLFSFVSSCATVADNNTKYRNIYIYSAGEKEIEINISKNDQNITVNTPALIKLPHFFPKKYKLSYHHCDRLHNINLKRKFKRSTFNNLFLGIFAPALILTDFFSNSIWDYGGTISIPESCTDTENIFVNNDIPGNGKGYYYGATGFAFFASAMLISYMSAANCSSSYDSVKECNRYKRNSAALFTAFSGMSFLFIKLGNDQSKEFEQWKNYRNTNFELLNKIELGFNINY